MWKLFDSQIVLSGWWKFSFSCHKEILTHQKEVLTKSVANPLHLGWCIVIKQDMVWPLSQRIVVFIHWQKTVQSALLCYCFIIISITITVKNECCDVHEQTDSIERLVNINDGHNAAGNSSFFLIYITVCSSFAHPLSGTVKLHREERSSATRCLLDMQILHDATLPLHKKKKKNRNTWLPCLDSPLQSLY